MNTRLLKWRVSVVQENLKMIIRLTSKAHFLQISKQVYNSQKSTHGHLNETACCPPLISLHILEHFRAVESTKINYVHGNHRQEIRFQDIVYFMVNK